MSHPLIGSRIVLAMLVLQLLLPSVYPLKSNNDEDKLVIPSTCFNSTTCDRNEESKSFLSA